MRGHEAEPLVETVGVGSCLVGGQLHQAAATTALYLHIGGDAINCAIGIGASLTGRDLIVALEGPIAADPAAQALISRLNKLPSLDTDLPEKVTGRSAAEDAARRAATRLERVLTARKLIDPTPEWLKAIGRTS